MRNRRGPRHRSPPCVLSPNVNAIEEGLEIGSRLARARFDAAAKSRIVVDLDAAVAMLAETIAALRKTIATEERRSKVNDPALPAYSLVA
jgi:hypothetical protein